MDPSDSGIHVERIEGISDFSRAAQYLVERGCPRPILPYPAEFEIIQELHRDISQDFHLCIFKKEEKIIGYAPYLRRKSMQNIRFGEKTIHGFAFEAIQILRPNTAQWGSISGTPQELLLFLAKNEPAMAITVPELDVNTELWRAIQDIGAKHYFLSNDLPFDHYLHYFKGNYDAFYQTKSKNSKKQIKYKTNVLNKRVGPGLKLEEYTAEQSLERFLQAANAISVKTYQAELFGEVIEDSAAMRRLFGLYARNGYFRSFILWADQLPIAFALGTQTPDGLYELSIMGYDPDWSEFNAGFNCTLKIVQHLYLHNTPERMDIGGGGNDLKRLFGTTKTVNMSPILLPKSLYGMALHRLGAISEQANRGIVFILDKLGLKTRVKQWFRRR